MGSRDFQCLEETGPSSGRCGRAPGTGAGLLGKRTYLGVCCTSAHQR